MHNMNIKKILVVILAVLITVAFIVTMFSGENSFKDVPKQDVSIAVAGDVMLARNMPGVLSFDSSPYAGVENVTSNVDLLLINFESASTSSYSAVKGDVPLNCDTTYVPLAKGNNLTVVALANNHVCDYGIGGMNDTIKYVSDAGMIPIGAGSNEDEAHRPANVMVKDRNITILNYMDSNNFAEYGYEVMPYANGSSPGYSAYDSQVAQKQISDAKNNGSDFVIVFMHYGNEYSQSPNDDQIRISHELIDSGADVVIGSHPHVTQGIEMYKGKPIFYSLGNFMFDIEREDTHSAYFVQLDLVNDTCECTVYPIFISGYLPQFMDPASGTALLEGLSPNCDDLNITDDGIGKLKFNLTEGDEH